MKKLTLFLILLGISCFSFAQEKCLTEILFREKAAQDPSLWQKRAEVEKFTQDFIKKSAMKPASAGTKRIIPVVFHVVYDNVCGAENISDAQILDQIRILNEEYSRTGADTANTPGPFKPIAAVCDVEFRLAKKDPNGNCTNGIVRVFSTLTNNARDNVKAVSYWNSQKYLNIWVVKSISGATPPNYVLGFAQFPGSGAASTDGVVLRSDVIGSIGTAGWNSEGKTAVHEVGHWLNLRHIWGDATCGDDMVNDTPVANNQNAGCPNFPKFNSCPGADMVKGENFSNYMDYTDGTCQNMFTLGQKARMDATFAGFRATLISPSNLIATGVNDGYTGADCKPKAEFCLAKSSTCNGSTVSLYDKSWRGKPTAWTWLLPGSSMPVVNAQNASVTYNTPGTYDITLIVSDSTGADTLVRPGAINVVADTGTFPYAQGFESGTFTGSQAVDQQGDNVKWTITNNKPSGGTYAAKLNNFSATITGNTHSLVLGPIDLSTADSVALSYKIAFAQKSSSCNDKMNFYYSFNCGQTWLFVGAGSYMLKNYSAGFFGTSWSPAASNYKSIVTDIPAGAYGTPNVLFKLEFQNGGGGNNFYIDDININKKKLTSTVNLSAYAGMNLLPNPSEGNTEVVLNLTKGTKADLRIYDLTGREVSTIFSNRILEKGEYRFPVELKQPGVYFVRLMSEGQVQSVKLINLK